MICIRLLVLLAVTAIVVSGEKSTGGCKCVIPQTGFPSYNGTYDREWWQKKQSAEEASLGAGSIAKFLGLSVYPENDNCALKTASSVLGVRKPLKNHEFNVVMVSTLDKVIRLTFSYDDYTTQVKFECNKDGQWTFAGTPIKVAAAINTVIKEK